MTKEQNIAVNTLFAASIICFLQLILGILVLITPFLFDNIIAPLIGQKESLPYFMAISAGFLKAPLIFVLILIALLVAALLYLQAAKNLRKNHKIKTWAITSLIVSFVLLHSGGNIKFLAAILGLIGSITGLMHQTQVKK